MGQALYRKYRSRSFDEVVGQDHVVNTLKQALQAGKVSHAYLFTGPRGVGKTSVARILAHEVNDLPYRDESIHLDIIEIDAASNRRIDEVRDLREKVHIAPSSAKYKVYIIDEVHMLTREAFNALLKTLEEPPAHCIFILATTESHKLPETIISRTQRFAFRPVAASVAARQLKKIAEIEKIDISSGALELLAKHGEGSFRDSIGMLDQLSGAKQPVSEQTVRNILGLPPEQTINELLAALEAKDSPRIVKILQEARDKALNPSAVASSLSEKLRANLTSGDSSDESVTLLKALLDVHGSGYPYDLLEISLLEAASSGSSRRPSKTVPTNANSTAATNEANGQLDRAELVSKKVAEAKAPVAAGSFKLDDWPEVVNKVKAEAASLYTALRLARPAMDGDRLILSFQFPLHQKKINQSKPKDLIGTTIEVLTGAKVAIECLVDKSIASDRVPQTEPERVDYNEPQIQTISNIFGGGQVLES